jgi:predicted nucleic-acid-binding Zn-ribbon protein
MKNLAAVKVKANAHYECQECGSTELIQAHHEIPGDDNSLIALCADCHSRKHPNVPKALFFNHNNQPYWHNKPASSLAKKWKVSSRSVIRAAKKLGIQSGELSPWDEELIRNNIPKLNRPKPKQKPEQIYPTRTCPRCGYSWRGIRKTASETSCPRCKNWIALNNPKPAQIRYERQIPLIPIRTEQNNKRATDVSSPP